VKTAPAEVAAEKSPASEVGRYKIAGKIPRRKAAATEPLLTFATVCCQVFLQAGNGHCHVVRQAAFLESGQNAQANQVAQAIAGCEVLVFEPSMLWTRDSVGREGAHEAPVENVAEENSREANKKQMLFSPIVRCWKDAGLKPCTT
jgi:hypothetical protein